MADLSRARQRILATIIALGVVSAAALVYLLLPYSSGAAQPAVVQRRAEDEYRQLKPKAVPLQGIDQKLAKAQKDGAAFMQNRLPSRYSDVVEELGKLAKANRISITSVSYTTEPGKLNGLESLQMHAGLAGQYVDLVKFINSVERNKMFFIIDTISLTGQKSDEVRLDVKLDTYLRSTASI